MLVKRILALSALVLVSGCAKYRSSSLDRFAPRASVKEPVVVACKALTAQDSDYYLGRNVLERGYRPIQITITNNTLHALEFSRNRVSLPTVSYQQVADATHFNTAGRVVGYLVGGLFIPFFWIGAIVDGIGASDANRQMDFDYMTKSLQETLITPRSEVTGLIFVPCHAFQRSFELSLYDRDAQETIIFNPTIYESIN